MKINIDFILFDVIGTTVQDSSNGESLILDCFYKSFCLHGYPVTYEIVNNQRGRSKREAIKNILESFKFDISLTEKIYSDFIELLKKNKSNFSEMKDANKLFEYLSKKHIKIGLGSGLPKEFLMEIIEQVGWESKRFDYIGSSEELGKGRPDPIMILDAMNKLRINDKSKVLKIGDTIVDIQEGKNAGVRTAAVLTGTQKREELIKHIPDFIFSDINDLKNLV